MGFKGHGDHAKDKARGGGGDRPFNYGIYEVFETADGEKRRRLKSLRLNPGEQDVPVCILDAIETDEDDAFAVALYGSFKYRGQWGNEAVSLEGVDARGCPLGMALRQKKMYREGPKKGKWTGEYQPALPKRFWILTCIQMTTFTFEGRDGKEITITNPRRYIPVPMGWSEQSKSRRVEEFQGYAKKLNGLRGQIFEVSRRNDKKSARIGENWFPQGKLTEEEMLSHFEEAAAAAGVPVEQYIQPCDYWTAFAPMDYDDALKAAQVIAADRGFSLDDALASGTPDLPDDNESEGEPAHASAGSDDEDDTIPF